MKITTRSLTHLGGTKPRTVELAGIFIPKFDVLFQFRTTFLELNFPLMHQQKPTDLQKKIQIQQVQNVFQVPSPPICLCFFNTTHKLIKPHIKLLRVDLLLENHVGFSMSPYRQPTFCFQKSGNMVSGGFFPFPIF